jgi:hypothetical protein
MNLQTRGRILRESEAPIREGDLLFNLFWGARVAVAGYVSITGEPSDSPAEQNRQMEDFMHLLRNNGVQVDAYVDLRDGQIRGNITAKTRYLIRGAPLRVAADAKAPAAKAPDDDKEKEPAKEAAPNTDRNDLINKSSRTRRQRSRVIADLRGKLRHRDRLPPSPQRQQLGDIDLPAVTPGRKRKEERQLMPALFVGHDSNRARIREVARLESYATGLGT